ncbi:MAG: DNA modification methylase [Patescibacteria group bacterium]|nr:MAG: DNA modification methylase [Patescibacteria group bacterium]
MPDTLNLQVEYVPIDSLKPCPWNPRKWDEAAKSQLRESLVRFGLVDPLIVNQHPNRLNFIVGGHFRHAMAKEIGIEKVPVVYVSLPEDKEKELSLRLNRNIGGWDYDLLKEFDTSLLLDVGFDNRDLSAIWDAALETSDDGFDVEKEAAKITAPKTKLGDMYALGKHVLICGDSRDETTIKKLVGSQTIDMVYSDPPFNIGLSYNKGISTSGKYGGLKTDDKLSDSAYREFLTKTIRNALTVSKPDAHVFSWCDENSVGLLQDLFTELGLQNRRTCLWIKNNFNMTPGVAFNKAYEPCVYATRGKPYLAPDVKNLNEVMNKEIGVGNRTIDDILDLFNIWLAKRLPGRDYEHPTEKPPTLHEKALRRCTKVGDAVLDLFCGSGSTLMACEMMKRRCFTCEIEPVFCDVTIKRYELLTGDKAKLLN